MELASCSRLRISCESRANDDDPMCSFTLSEIDQRDDKRLDDERDASSNETSCLRACSMHSKGRLGNSHALLKSDYTGDES